MNKQFFSVLYLKENGLFQLESDGNYKKIIESAIKDYEKAGFDGIIIHDLANSETEKETHLDLLKELCASTSISIIGSAVIHKMEDVKKLLYVGCEAVLLDMCNIPSLDLVKEVSLKFGKEKIWIEACDDLMKYSSSSFFEQYCSCALTTDHNHEALIQQSKISYLCEITTMPSSDELEIRSEAMLGFYSKHAGLVDEVANYKQNSFHLESQLSFSELKTDANGLVPVVVQEEESNEVLMLAYMNETSFMETLRTGKMTYFSRSRQSLWLKGETSGHFQYVVSLMADCDKDTILAKVRQVGVACHTGAKSCFFEPIVVSNKNAKSAMNILETVYAVIADRKVNPKEGSYTNYLLDKGLDKILKKMGEEATEIVIAAKNPNANEIKYEISDYLYHMMVLMVEKGVTWNEIAQELSNR